MKTSYIRLVGPEYMAGALRATSGKDMYKIKFPSIKTFKQMVVSAGGVPHSPLRTMLYRIYVQDVKSWVTVHYVRHHIGVQFYVKSQRTDRDSNLVQRDSQRQDELINMMFDINANALLTMAQARLCLKAAPETREVMAAIRHSLVGSACEYDQIIGMTMGPPCEWYEKCFEPKPCGRHKWQLE
jgi:hypothetical protein